jgi:branched-chain amino acid transport system ATP-binding protein
VALLEVRGVSKAFRGLRAVQDVSFDVAEGAIAAMIGPNGAGKTTCFNVVAGVFPPDAGEVSLGGRRITGLRAHEVCRAGIGRTFQVVKPFPQMTVLDNVVVGALNAAARVADAEREARRVLALLHLDGKAGTLAASLTLPERKRLEVARAMATRPRLLLLDEAMSGLTPLETAAAVQLVRRIHEDLRMTVCVVEHVMEVVMPLSHRVVVLDYGTKIADGPPEQVVRDQRVISAYLGERRATR